MSSIRWQPGYWLGKEYKRFPTYRLLKKALPEDLKEQNIIYVSRSKRGEWGEYFENWELIDGKPKKVKEGWM